MTIESNPIYKLLVRDIKPQNREGDVGLAAIGPFVLVGAVACCATSPSSGGQGLVILLILAAVLIVAALMALPAAASALSAAATHRLVKGDEFQLILLTTLPRRDIMKAMVHSLKFRTTTLRYAATSLLVSIFTTPLISISARYGSLGSIELKWILIYVGVAAFCIWMEIQLSQLAVINGIYVAMRLRKGSIAGASVTAAVLVAATYLIGPPLAIGLILLTRYQSPEAYLMLVGMGYAVLSLIGNSTLLGGIEDQLLRHFSGAGT